MSTHETPEEVYSVGVRQRFWAKVNKMPGQGPKGECWEWQAGRNGEGYGRFRVGSQMYLAHRVSHELSKGAIPINKLVCHDCDNPGCVNPAHLYAGTHLDNVSDMIQRGRAVYKGVGTAGPRVTHCKRGHELSGDNLLTGTRKCRICINQRQGERYRKANDVFVVRPSKDHCKRGHELSGANLVKGAATRRCRICKNERAKKYRAQ